MTGWAFSAGMIEEPDSHLGCIYINRLLVVVVVVDVIASSGCQLFGSLTLPCMRASSQPWPEAMNSQRQSGYSSYVRPVANNTATPFTRGCMHVVMSAMPPGRDARCSAMGSCSYFLNQVELIIFSLIQYYYTPSRILYRSFLRAWLTFTQRRRRRR